MQQFLSKNILIIEPKFPFNKRMVEVFARSNQVSVFNFDGLDSDTCQTKTQSTIHKKLLGLIYSKNIDHVVFSSELFFPFAKLDGFNTFVQCLETLQTFLRIKVIFVLLNDILHTEWNGIQGNAIDLVNKEDWVPEALNRLKEVVTRSGWLTINVSSTYTYFSTNNLYGEIQLNRASKDKRSKDSKNSKLLVLHFADDVIQFISDSFEKSGVLSYDRCNSIYGFDEYLSEINLLVKEIRAGQPNNVEAVSCVNNVIKVNVNPNIKTVFNQSGCSVNLIYRNKPEEKLNHRSVAQTRIHLGMQLANSIPQSIIEKIDIVVPVPETGKYYAQGLAIALGKPYVEAIYKTKNFGRSFEINDQDKRRSFIVSKISLIEELIRDRTIVVVDEAIFTGATLKIVSNMLRKVSLKNVYIAVPSPECRFRCSYGMMPDRPLLSEYVRDSSLASYFDVNSVFLQRYNDFKFITNQQGFHCTQCFDGKNI